MMGCGCSTTYASVIMYVSTMVYASVKACVYLWPYVYQLLYANS